MRILIRGLPASGKTTLAVALYEFIHNAGIECHHYNADMVRLHYNDWDFTEDGRCRQANRMRTLADQHTGIRIVDFVCPKLEYVDIVKSDILIEMDTIDKGRFEDTNKLYESYTQNRNPMSTHTTFVCSGFPTTKDISILGTWICQRYYLTRYTN